MANVLIIGINYAPETTGIGPYTSAMARGLSDQHHLEVITTLPHYPAWRVDPSFPARPRRRTEDGVRVTRLRHYVPGDPAGLQRILSEATFAVKALFTRAARPDVVVAVSPALLSAVPALLRARVRRVPLAIIVQDLYSSAVGELGLAGGLLARAVARLEGALLRAADGVATVHPRMGQAISDRFGIPVQDIAVIRNWSRVSAPSTAREVTRDRMGWAGDRVVMHVGNMGKKQALELVVDAARHAETHDPGLRFVLVGDGSQRAMLEERSAGVRNLQLVDPVPEGEFADLLAAADVLLLHERPGMQEMCAPSKLTSYFAAGRPVLAATTDGSAAGEDVRASGAGVVVPPGDPDALVSAADRLIDDQASSSAMGERGVAFAHDHLSEQAALSSFAGWLDSLMRR